MSKRQKKIKVERKVYVGRAGMVAMSEPCNWDGDGPSWTITAEEILAAERALFLVHAEPKGNA